MDSSAAASDAVPGRLVVEPATVAPDPAVPGSGVVAVFAALDPGADLRWGVAGTVLREDDGGWVVAGQFALALDSWAGVGGVVGPRESLTVRRIGLRAGPGGVGPLGWLDLGGLAPGSYLLAHQAFADGDERSGTGRPLAGAVEVLPAGAVAPAPFGPPPRRAFLVGPAAVVAGSPVRVAAHVALDPGSGGSVDDEAVHRGEALGTLATTVRVEARDPASGTWTPVHTDLPVRWTGEPDLLQLETDLPALADGGYRVVLGSSVGGDLWAPFWALAAG